jgi:hypothetical protein
VGGRKRKFGAEEVGELAPEILQVVLADAGEAELFKDGQEVA